MGDHAKSGMIQTPREELDGAAAGARRRREGFALWCGICEANALDPEVTGQALEVPAIQLPAGNEHRRRPVAAGETARGRDGADTEQESVRPLPDRAARDTLCVPLVAPIPRRTAQPELIGLRPAHHWRDCRDQLGEPRGTDPAPLIGCETH